MTEEELVERVARAISVQQLGVETRWRWFVKAARAAIAAVREAGWKSPEDVQDLLADEADSLRSYIREGGD